MEEPKTDDETDEEELDAVKPSDKADEKIEEQPTEKPKALFKKKENSTHIVKKGETLFRISKQYNVKVDDIKKWNNLSKDGLEVGQELIIKKN